MTTVFNLPLDDFIERINDNYSLEDICDILGISGSELLEAFSDRVLERRDLFPSAVTELDFATQEELEDGDGV